MTTRPDTLAFADWLPDLPSYANPGALIARNVIPQISSYRQLNDITSFSNALDDVCLGAFWAQDANNVVFNYAGDAGKIYQLTLGTTWADISGPSAPYGAENWDFTKFGNRIIAADGNSPLQFIDMGGGPNFADLPNAPSARRVATIRDFVMVGDVANLGPNFVQWCAYNNSELWTPSLATQSDFQELFGRGGRVQRIVPGEYAVIFMEHSVFRADYSGPPTIFQIDEVEEKRGTPAPGSVTWTGGYVYYYGWDNFYRFNGQSSEPISANRVSNWFQQNAASTALETMRAAIDRRNRLVIWGFKSSSSAVINDRLLIYNWGADKWSYAEVDTAVIDEFLTSGFSLDELDVPLPAGIDLDSIPVDSDQFAGGALNLQAFDINNQSATFDGLPLKATLDTKEISSPSNDRMYVNAVRPLIEGPPTADVTVSVGKRNGLRDNVNFGIPRAPNPFNGEANMRENARYMRFRVDIEGGFDHANGVKVQSSAPGGRR